MLTLSKNQLRAALSHAAVKDTRYWLNGVCVDVASTGSVYLVGCDGSSLFVGRVSGTCEQKGPFQIVIPSDAVKLASKGKGDVVLKARGDGRYELGDVVFAPIDGRYPDWRRVARSSGAVEMGNYDPELLERSQAGLREWIERKGTLCRVEQHGTGAAIVQAPGCDDAFCVVMALRLKDESFSSVFVADI